MTLNPKAKEAFEQISRKTEGRLENDQIKVKFQIESMNVLSY